jgi:hypothetical protein
MAGGDLKHRIHLGKPQLLGIHGECEQSVPQGNYKDNLSLLP